MKKIILFSIAFYLIFGVDLAKSASIDLYGFKPASVDSVIKFQTRNKPFQPKEFVFITVFADIDKNGSLKSLSVNDIKENRYLSYIESYLKQLTFKPAELHNKKIKSILPVKIVFSRQINSPTFTFPLYYDTLITDNKLFELSCELNKVQLPSIEYFPSYFSDVKVMDTSNRYPYIIEKISISEGKITEISNFKSYHDPFIQQIESAILYSKIQFPQIKGKEISTDLFLMTSFFPQLSYPIVTYHKDSLYSSNKLFQNSVKIINKNSSILSAPIPKKIPSDKYPRNILQFYVSQVIEVYVRIDTLGYPKIFRFSESQDKMKKSIRDFVAKMKFFPAINNQNELQEFHGYIRIEPFDAIYVRVSYLWLE